MIAPKFVKSQSDDDRSEGVHSKLDALTFQSGRFSIPFCTRFAVLIAEFRTQA